MADCYGHAMEVSGAARFLLSNGAMGLEADGRAGARLEAQLGLSGPLSSSANAPEER